MPEPVDHHELGLVVRAIQLGLTIGGCCEWQERAARRIRASPPLQGLTPEGIKRLLCEFVATHPEEVHQVIEKRSEYSEHRFYYKTIIPVDGLRRGLFVEVVLIDDDSDYPVVSIVNAHEQGR